MSALHGCHHKAIFLVLSTSQLLQRHDNIKPSLHPKFTDSGCLEVATQASWVHSVMAFTSSQGQCSLAPRPCSLRCTGAAELKNAMGTAGASSTSWLDVHTWTIKHWLLHSAGKKSGERCSERQRNSKLQQFICPNESNSNSRLYHN